MMVSWISENYDTPDGRQVIQRKLLQFAKIANETGGVAGLFGLFSKISTDVSRRKILRWLLQYTPIRFDVDGSGNVRYFIVPKNYQKTDLVDGQLNPWYLLDAVSLEQPSRSKASPRQGVRSSRDLSDGAFNRKVLRSAVDSFLREPSERTKRKLLNAIDSIPLDRTAKNRSIFLQGGATGLKK